MMPQDNAKELDLEVFKEYTPGPWAVPIANMFRVIAPEAEHANEPSGMCPPYPWAIICEMNPESIPEPSVSARNARLIAAAPTLLAELIKKREEVERLRGLMEKLVHASKHGSVALDNARDALAREEG